MLKVIVCEDNVNQQIKMRDILSRSILMEDYDMELALISTKPCDVLAYLENHTITGLYFLDIDLKADINGIELAKEIRKRDPRGFIVFVTNHPGMSIESFKYKIEAMDFIGKDEIARDTSRISSCLKNAYQKYTNANTTIQKVLSIKNNGRVINVPFQEIIYIETTEVKHRLRLHGENQLIDFYGQFVELEKVLDERFAKSHRSFIVNRDKIQVIDFSKKIIYMTSGDTCLLSKRVAKKFR